VLNDIAVIGGHLLRLRIFAMFVLSFSLWAETPDCYNGSITERSFCYAQLL